MAFDPQTRLLAGSRLLAPLLNLAGFGYVPGPTSEHGHRSRGRFVAGDRELELVYQWGLAEVRYRVGKRTLEHSEYMELLGVTDRSAFLNEQHDISCEGFDGLHKDLLRFADDFLRGDAERFCRLADRLNAPATIKFRRA